ncbi:MAG: zinc-ribbon domain-containing protein [Candidatus Hodarchaeota archaeon]
MFYNHYIVYLLSFTSIFLNPQLGPILWNIAIIPCILPSIVAFGYFFLCELFLGGKTSGKTIGKAILGIQSVKVKKEELGQQFFTFKDVALNAFAKSFILLLDMIFGYSRKEKSKNILQIRWTQQITDVWVIGKKVPVKIPAKVSLPEEIDIAACSKCGCQILPNAKFCVNCGNSMIYEEPVHIETVHEKPVREKPSFKKLPHEEYAIFCLQCGFQLPLNVKFCVNCGRQLGPK